MKISQMKTIDPCQLKTLSEEENQNISFWEPLFSVYKISGNVANDTTKTSKEKTNAIKDLLVVEDKHIGKFSVVFWPKPKVYYWGKQLKVLKIYKNI